MGGHHLKIFLQEFQELNKAASVGGGGGREVEVGRAGASAGGLCSAALPCMTQWRHQLHTCSRQTSCPHICPPPPTPLLTERHRAPRKRCQTHEERESSCQYSWPKPTKRGQVMLLVLSILRIVFIPLFILCNASPSNRSTEVKPI